MTENQYSQLRRFLSKDTFPEFTHMSEKAKRRLRRERVLTERKVRRAAKLAS